jgi:hypothetical protein
MNSSSYVLVIPYEMKDTAKENKCQWNKEDKYWYMKTHNDDPVLMKFVNDYSRVYLNVRYEEKEWVKQKGAKWDNDVKKWFTYKSDEKLQQFMEFKDKNKREQEIFLKEKKEYEEKEEKRHQEMKEMKAKWIQDGHKEEEFYIWYSVNISGHE